jgi:large subunit ribosomal protein L15e
MSMYKYIRQIWKKPQEGLGDLWRERLIKWRRQPTTLRIDRPTRLDRARSLGYKAKPGIFVVRQRVPRGGHKGEESTGIGRKPKNYRTRVDLKISYQVIAERRAARQYMNNCEVLNSYWVARDGRYYWYEVIMVDKSHPAIKADPHYNWVVSHANRARAFRGLTSAGRKSRGLRHTGTGTEKMRPSRRAVIKLRNQRIHY